ncbi:MAG: efflux RND transporter periplasmic adaptor subunit [Ignavibacteria bacterium]
MEEKKLRTKNIIITVLTIMLVAVIAAGGYFLLLKKDMDKVSAEEIYTCPMHPQIVQDHSGQCPICGMDLVLKTDVTGKEEHTEQDISGMNLEAVKLSPSQQVLANVQTEKVQMKQFSGVKTFNGVVKINEKNFRHISTPVYGKILNQYINFEGQIVSKGQPAFDIYSPDLVSTQKEYLLALDNYLRVEQSKNLFVIEQAASLVEAAKTRLRLWEITSAQIEELERTKEIKNSITVYSKYSGVITKKIAHAGHWAMAGEDIYDIADLSTVWVIANIYESDAQYVKNGQLAEIVSSSYPDESIKAKINYINPVFNAGSRTLEVRIDVVNKNYKLKPDMYVKVKINTYAAQTAAVPKNAVIRTGERNLVYIEKEKGVYVPAEVQIGYEQDGYYAVTGGIKEGDIVVTSGGFLIDSETQIQKGFTSGHEGHNMNTKNSDEELKINPDQDIMKDMEKKNQHKH